MQTKKLSDAQRRVLKWMQGGWEARKANGAAVHINGKRVCNIDTMTALKNQGLVEESGQFHYKITEAGRLAQV